MSRPYIIVVVGINYRTNDLAITVLNDVCESLDEAIGAGMRAAMKKYPPSEGWAIHKADVKEFSREILEQMLARARPLQEIPEELR